MLVKRRVAKLVNFMRGFPGTYIELRRLAPSCKRATGHRTWKSVGRLGTPRLFLGMRVRRGIRSLKLPTQIFVFALSKRLEDAL